MAEQNNPAMTTSLVSAVLNTWVTEFLVDVPAVHNGDQYLIDHDVLVEHIANLSYDDTVEIMLSVEDNYLIK